MAEEPDRSSRIANLTSGKALPARRSQAIMADRRRPRRHHGRPGLAALVLSNLHAQRVAETVGDAGLPKPAAEECAIARAAMTAIHTSGDAARWMTGVVATTMTLKAHSQVVNPSDFPDYSDDEADDARGKVEADWRNCPGMADFVRGLHWAPLSSDYAGAELSLSRPGLNKAHDEAKLYEIFTAPAAGDDSDTPRRKRGPWLVTLRPAPGGVWKVTATDDLSGK